MLRGRSYGLQLARLGVGVVAGPSWIVGIRADVLYRRDVAGPAPRRHSRVGCRRGEEHFLMGVVADVGDVAGRIECVVQVLEYTTPVTQDVDVGFRPVAVVQRPASGGRRRHTSRILTRSVRPSPLMSAR